MGRRSRALIAVVAAWMAACRPGAAARPQGNPVAPVAPTIAGPPVFDAGAGTPAAPRKASFDAIQASPLALNTAELRRLGENGFVISERERFRAFADGWLAIYKADLPLYISADALIHAVHRSYDEMLRDLETSILVPRLEALLVGMRANLATRARASLSSTARADADLFTAVALSLLRGAPESAVAGGDGAAIANWFDMATAGKGRVSLPVFGTPRTTDLSQFKPRGHYAVRSSGSGAPSPEGRYPIGLDRYFRALMWLGRIDARIVGPGHSAAMEVRRRELELACAVRELMGASEMAEWQALENTMNTFVGERDAMGPVDIDRFYRDLGIAGISELASVPDRKILDTLSRQRYGHQRISSDLFFGAQPGETTPAPLPTSFSFTGQRYIVDSQVMSDLVYDRVRGPVPRMMPSPLDVAYAALDNGQARALLQPEIERYRYGADLQRAHDAIEARGEPFWESSLYNLWLGALRALSPHGTAAGLPRVATTDAWGRRMLSTQLASWAELRHDTILYAKQSYSAGIMCSFPDAYVDPYPAFYARLAKFADLGKALVERLDVGAVAADAERTAGAMRIKVSTGGFFEQLGRVSRTLGHIAEEELAGRGPSAEELAFVNGAITEDPPAISCGPAPRIVHGWYVDLFYGGDPLAFKPTIADVHTQWTDQAGNEVGRVLHVGTGSPRTMVVRVDDSRSFVGVVSDYTELVTEHFQRLDDDGWRRSVSQGNPEDPPWMVDLVVR